MTPEMSNYLSSMRQKQRVTELMLSKIIQELDLIEWGLIEDE